MQRTSGQRASQRWTTRGQATTLAGLHRPIGPRLLRQGRPLATLGPLLPEKVRQVPGRAIGRTRQRTSLTVLTGLRLILVDGLAQLLALAVGERRQVVAVAAG